MGIDECGHWFHERCFEVITLMQWSCKGTLTSTCLDVAEHRLQLPCVPKGTHSRGLRIPPRPPTPQLTHGAQPSVRHVRLVTPRDGHLNLLIVSRFTAHIWILSFMFHFNSFSAPQHLATPRPLRPSSHPSLIRPLIPLIMYTYYASSLSSFISSSLAPPALPVIASSHPALSPDPHMMSRLDGPLYLR